MEVFRAVILGIVQGVTEFLPISSDGHLLLIRQIFRWPDEGLLFDASLHLGTFFAVLIYFRQTWGRLFRAVFKKGEKQDIVLLKLLILATAPAALFGYVGRDILEDYSRNVFIAGAGFLASGLFLYFADKVNGAENNRKELPNYKQSVAIGFLQVLALLPGLSRSGSTIAGGVFSGLSRSQAAEFSFLMSLPITGGAGFLALFESGAGMNGMKMLSLFFGFIFAFLVGLWAIGFLMKILSNRKTFKPFILYLAGAAILSFAIGMI